MRLVLLGPPGVGKGTQAGCIAEAYSIPHVSTGDTLRAGVAMGTEAGKEAKSYMDAGELVPDGVVTALVRDRLSGGDCEPGFLLDGYPRTRAQAEALDGLLSDAGQSLDAVLCFTAPEDVLVERLGGRRLCRGCSKGYHVRFMPPATEGVCNECGGEVYQRDDDQPDAIRQRLKVYADQTQELVTYYRDRGLLLEVRADRPVEEVAESVQEVLGDLAGRNA